MIHPSIEYGGFGRRLLASIIDTVLLTLILMPLLYLLVEEGGSTAMAADSLLSLLFNYLLPIIIVLIFWRRYRGTPGKLWLDLQVVDASSHQTLRWGQSLLRYIGYFISALPLGLGFFWILWDKRRQGWHDKLAGSVVLHLPLRRDLGDDLSQRSLSELQHDLAKGGDR
jgi:uncharacterized RDD family membrane protein YckC